MFHIDFSELPHMWDMVEDSGSSHSSSQFQNQTEVSAMHIPCP